MNCANCQMPRENNAKYCAHCGMLFVLSPAESAPFYSPQGVTSQTPFSQANSFAPQTPPQVMPVQPPVRQVWQAPRHDAEGPYGVWPQTAPASYGYTAPMMPPGQGGVLTADRAPAMPAYAAYDAAAAAAGDTREASVLSTGRLLGFLLLMCIPLVNLICCLVWALRGSTGRQLKNLARAGLILVAFEWILAALAALWVINGHLGTLNAILDVLQ